VPGWVKRIFGWLRLNPILTANAQGKMGLAGFHIGMGADPEQLARSAVRRMQPDTMYRVVIAHANNADGAARARQHILQGHGRIHSCHITDAGPALGAHFGPRSLIVGFAPQPPVLN
jgi:fatty acid-binding protein DegV